MWWNSDRRGPWPAWSWRPHLFTSSVCMRANSHQLGLTLCDPIDYRWPGSFVHRILQARILERVAKLSSRGSMALDKFVTMSDASVCSAIKWG